MSGVRHWYFNELERVALCALLKAGYPFAALIYQLELRVNMDYATYIVGIRRRISVAGILELIEMDPLVGSHRPKKRRDRHFVRRQFSALEKFGLIEKIPDKPMCYRLLLANVASLRAQEESAYESAYEGAGCSADEGAQSKGRGLSKKPVKLRVVEDSKTENTPMIAPKIPGDLVEQSAQENAQESATSEKVLQQQQEGDFQALHADQPSLSFEQLAEVDMTMVVGAYHAVLPALPVVRFYDNQGYRFLVARIWFHPGPDGQPTEVHKTEKFWRQYFTACGRSDFLMGRAFNDRRGKFKANFKFLLGDDVFLKVLNGEYS
jgi:hypothetical protein